MGPPLLSGLAGVSKGIKMSFWKIEDVVNFLASMAQSLNAYRPAISSTHEKVDGVTVGTHPAVIRLLKGAFHQRPPQAQYSSFWDVGIVIQYIKGLDPNEHLSLKQLTLKTAMLLDHPAQLT